jgi:hypothetical protein
MIELVLRHVSCHIVAHPFDEPAKQLLVFLNNLREEIYVWVRANGHVCLTGEQRGIVDGVPSLIMTN